MSSDNIVKLEQARREMSLTNADAAASAGQPSDTVPDFIKPRSIADMTDTEADAFLVDLRNRRMKAQQLIKQQKEAKAAIASAAARAKIEKKIAQVERAEAKAGDAIDKLETLLFQLRALVLQNE